MIVLRMIALLAVPAALNFFVLQSVFAKDEPKWIEVHTSHFSVLSDAGEKRGREVALRMEQMRTVFGQVLLKNKLRMPVPITVVALKSDKQYGLVAPAKQSMAAGFYVPGWDRIYIVLNLFETDPWQAVAHPLAHYFLNYNYPPAAGWFDEGLAEYFGSIHIGKQVEIGGDPELQSDWHEDVFDEMRRDPNTPQSLTQLLSSPVWLSMVDLFTMKHDGSGAREGTHNTMYYAQSWMVVHYLVNKNKMPEAGTYFDLVQNQKVPVEKAMVQAFDMSPEQMRDLQQLTQDPKDNEAARRGLARNDLRDKKYDAAADELEKATDLNPRDPWIWYYRSALKYQKAQATRQPMQGLANMMQDLRAVADWYPELADAYNMLGVARVEGGGINSALEAQRQAIALAPRNLEYQYNLGQIYVAGKKWDLAREVFTRLKAGPDKAAAAAAKQQLEDLDTVQKYGVRPQRAGENAAPAGAASTPAAATSAPAPAANPVQDDEDADAAPKPAPVKPGTTGPVQFLKGKIVSSDCSKSPEATVTILSGMTTYLMHASDYKSLLVIGQDQFSCEWKNRLVSVNYRAVGKTGGELVSIEVR
jgi:tetratricopeptide (TPR) repeat protein